MKTIKYGRMIWLLASIIFLLSISATAQEKVKSEIKKVNLEDYAGTFKNNNMTIVFSVQDGILVGEPEGMPKSDLNYINDNEFLVVSAQKNIKFIRDAGGKVIKAVFNFYGEEVTVEKVISENKINLNDYTGIFKNTSIKLIFTIENGVLIGEPEGMPRSEMNYINNDEFLVVSAQKNIKFIRNAEGKVIKATFNFYGEDITVEKELQK